LAIFETYWERLTQRAGIHTGVHEETPNKTTIKLGYSDFGPDLELGGELGEHPIAKVFLGGVV